MSQKTKDYTAAELLTESLMSYSGDVVSTKYSNPIDGLKCVTRRILFCLGTQKDKDSMTALIGDASKLHQGGDASIYSAMIRLAQPFSIGRPLIYLPGNFGDYTKPDSAGHPRYLEVASSEFSRDLFFNGVYAKSLPMTYSKDFRRMEPQYFIPRLPTALLMNSLTIGYGFKSTTPQLNFGNLCSIVMAFAECRNNTPSIFPPYKDIAEYMLPDYPTHNFIRNKQELLDSYNCGKFEHPIELDGVLELSNYSCRLKNTPFGTIPGNVIENLLDILQKQKNHWLLTLLKDINNYGGTDLSSDFLMEFKNTTKIFTILEPLKKLLQVTDTIHPMYYFVRNNKIAHLGPYELVDAWYSERTRSIMAGIKGKQADLQMELQKLRAHYIVCDYPDKVVAIVRNAVDEDSCVRDLANEFSELTRMQSRILANAKISTLTKQSKSNLSIAIEKVLTELEEVKNGYGKLHENIYNDAQFLQKKYAEPRKTLFTSDFIGYVHIDRQGIIQFKDESDLLDILRNFRLSKYLDIQFYQKEYPFKYPLLNNRFCTYKQTGLPREFPCTKMILSPVEQPHTLVLIDGTVAVLDGMKTGKDESITTIPVGPRFYGINKNGEVIRASVNDYSSRKSISKGAQSDLIYALPSSCKDMVVVHMNTSAPNEIRFDRILSNKEYLGRLMTTPSGETRILAVVSANTKMCYIGLDPACLNKISTNILRIENIKTLFGKANTSLLELSKVKSSEYGKYFQKHKELAQIADFKLPKS